MENENIEKPTQCQSCGVEELPLTRAMIPGEPYLCRRCHAGGMPDYEAAAATAAAADQAKVEAVFTRQFEFHEAIGVLAKGIVELEALAKAQGEMIQAQDAAIKGLVRLQTSDHVSIEYLSHQKERGR
jgi:hypothetical protein